uniref:Uncharacterized protein n=1 Tax=Lepeophtheirus salmonis TaxID=72036 RepID=A0A0K2UN87_LEPSM
MTASPFRHQSLYCIYNKDGRMTPSLSV